MQAMGSKQLVDSGCFLCFQVDDGRLRSLIIGKEGVNIKQLRQNTSVDVHIGDFFAFRSWCENVWNLFLPNQLKIDGERIEGIQVFGLQPDSGPDFYLQTVAKPDSSNECYPQVQLIHV